MDRNTIIVICSVIFIALVIADTAKKIKKNTEDAEK